MVRPLLPAVWQEVRINVNMISRVDKVSQKAQSAVDIILVFVGLDVGGTCLRNGLGYVSGFVETWPCSN